MPYGPGPMTSMSRMRVASLPGVRMPTWEALNIKAVGALETRLVGAVIITKLDSNKRKKSKRHLKFQGYSFVRDSLPKCSLICRFQESVNFARKANYQRSSPSPNLGMLLFRFIGAQVMILKRFLLIYMRLLSGLESCARDG